MICNCVIKNYLSNTSKGWILRAKPIQYKINPKELGVIFADIEEWMKDYSALYLDESKDGELKEFLKVFYSLGVKYIKKDK